MRNVIRVLQFILLAYAALVGTIIIWTVMANGFTSGTLLGFGTAAVPAAVAYGLNKLPSVKPLAPQSTKTNLLVWGFIFLGIVGVLTAVLFAVEIR